MKQCSIKGCGRGFRARGWCSMHWGRWSRNGSPDIVTRTHVLHGKTKTPEYITWQKMKERCYNPKHKGFKHYGGSGVTICDRWLDSFLNFYKDMGRKPTPEHSIDRIDPKGDYKPSNCKWATNLEQSRNKRPRENKSGYTGIFHDKKRNKYQASISVCGTIKTIGRYSSLEEAIGARETAKAIYW